jgi:GTP-binding protein HflX
VRTRIRILKKILKGVEIDRREQRKRRSTMARVALVGYTNAGKSTLMNALSDADVLTEDLLFATLDATTRKVDLPDGHAALLTDTVGLIKKLPHHLVVSFHATLEEVADADLLLHIVDASRPHCEKYLELAEGVLEEIGVKGKPVRLVFNKVDRAEERAIERLKEVYPGSLFTSATRGEGLEEVRRAICAFVESREEVLDVEIPYSDGKTISTVYAMGEVLSRADGDDGLTMQVRVSAADAARLRKMGVVK